MSVCRYNQDDGTKIAVLAEVYKLILVMILMGLRCAAEPNPNSDVQVNNQGFLSLQFGPINPHAVWWSLYFQVYQSLPVVVFVRL